MPRPPSLRHPAGLDKGKHERVTFFHWLHMSFRVEVVKKLTTQIKLHTFTVAICEKATFTPLASQKPNRALRSTKFHMEVMRATPAREKETSNFAFTQQNLLHLKKILKEKIRNFSIINQM